MSEVKETLAKVDKYNKDISKLTSDVNAAVKAMKKAKAEEVAPEFQETAQTRLKELQVTHDEITKDFASLEEKPVKLGYFENKKKVAFQESMEKLKKVFTDAKLAFPEKAEETSPASEEVEEGPDDDEVTATQADEVKESEKDETAGDDEITETQAEEDGESVNADETTATGAQSDDEEEDEESEDEDLDPNEPKIYTSVAAYKSPPGDDDFLSFSAGEDFVMLKKSNSWWLARNSKNQEGYVPINYLTVKKVAQVPAAAPRQVTDPQPLAASEAVEEEDEEEEEEEEEFESEGEDDVEVSEMPDEEDYEDEDEDEDEDEEDETEALDQSQETTSQKSQSVKKPSKKLQRLIDSVLALDGFPDGFRGSSLGFWHLNGFAKGKSVKKPCNLAFWLQPKLSSSCLGYQLPQKTSGTKLQRILSFQKVLEAPTVLPQNVQVMDRLLRLCLFDGKSPASNVCTIRALPAKDMKTWTFESRVSDVMKTLEHGEIFIQYPHSNSEISLLMEVSIVVKTTKSPYNVELSIGHAQLPLFESNGAQMLAKSHELILQGGTPFEKDVAVDSKLPETTTGVFRSNKKTRLAVKVSTPSKEVIEYLNHCPTCLIGHSTHLVLIALYSSCLTDDLQSLLNDKNGNSAPFYAPHLRQFIESADQLDVMDTFRKLWIDFAKKDRSYRKPIFTGVMKQEFIRLLGLLYPITQLWGFQPFIYGDATKEQSRLSSLNKPASKLDYNNFLLDDSFFVPFSMEEVTFRPINADSLPFVSHQETHEQRAK